MAEQLTLPRARRPERRRLHVRHDEELERRLTAELRRHVGREQAVRARTLGRLVLRDERAVRLAVKRLIEEHGLPIGSAPTKPPGFFWIDTAADQEEAEKNLWNRAMSCLARLAKLRQISMETLFGQLPLKYAELNPEGAPGGSPSSASR
jgi:hypothetical protein